jgi:hypothetical protein
VRVMSEVGGTRLEVGLMLSLTVLGVGSRAELAAQFHDNEPRTQEPLVFRGFPGAAMVRGAAGTRR